MKRILSVIILFILLLAALPVLSSCAGADGGEIFSFEESDGGYTVAAILTTDRNIVIPSEHAGKKVTAIKESAFYRNEDLRTVTIPATIETVGPYAFADCPNLHKVVFLEGGRCAIGDSAFEGCTLLSTLDFNGSVCTVGDRAFRDCKRIAYLKVGNELTDIGEDAFMNCERMLFSAPKYSPAYVYALSHHLCTEFTDSLYFLYFEIVCGVALAVILLFVARKILKKRKKTKKRT